jgi:DNA-binding NarL/FixJ family response regulator
MERGQRADAIDTRIIFRAYAALTIVAGTLLVCWGPLWLGTDLAGLRWGKAALIRVLGSMLIAIGCFIAPLADLAPPSRRRALLWLSVGHTTTRRILERAPSVRVIALTASTDEARMMGVLRAGAVGYVRKDADPEILLDAVRAVARGKTYIDPHLARQVLRAPVAHDDLTAREVEVLRQLALGRSNREIAEALFISEETVKTHLGHLFAKLQVENRAQAIVQALKRGLVALEELG